MADSDAVWSQSHTDAAATDATSTKSRVIRLNDNRVQNLTEGARLDPVEVLLYFSAGDAKHDRPPMRADGGICRGAQFLEDMMHLLERQRIVRLHGGVARGSGGNLLERVLDP